MFHDICYRDHPGGKQQCDKIMLDRLKDTKPVNFREAADKTNQRLNSSFKHMVGAGGFGEHGEIKRKRKVF